MNYKIWDSEDDDEIPKEEFGQDKKRKHWFTRKGLIRIKNFNIAGLIFIFIGFLIQFIFLLLK